jgi:acyl transferase domain-containing protein
VNSLGFGGTNVHVILEEPPLPAPTPVADRPRLVVWSARNDAAEQAYRTALADHFRECADDNFPMAVSTLQEGRTRYPVRGFAVAASRPDAVDAVLRESLTARSVPSGGPRPVAFLFPGQGSQYAGMASRLYRADPTFTAEIDAALDALETAGARVRPLWTDGTEDQLLDTAVAQPLLFAVEYALARMLLQWGVKPAGMIGHSVGELVAAAVAGMMPLPVVAAMVVARGRAMAVAPPGTMAAVRASAGELGELPEGVTVAADNGPQQTVIAGTDEAVSGFLSTLASRRVPAARLRTAHAFHSPLMSASARTFAGELPDLVVSPATIPVVSSATARPLTVEDAGSAEFWAEQVRSPVRFRAALDELLGTGDWLLVEVGPGRALTSVLRGYPDVTAGRHTVVPTLPPRPGSADDLHSVLEAAGALWAEGHELDWAALRPGEPLRRTAVPGYPYQRRAYWARSDPAAAPGSAARASAPVADDTTGSPSPVEAGTESREVVERVAAAAAPQRDHRCRRTATQLGDQFGLADPRTDVDHSARSPAQLQRKGAYQCGQPRSHRLDQFAAGDVDRPVGEDQNVWRCLRPGPGTLLEEIEETVQHRVIGRGPDAPGVDQPVGGAALGSDRLQCPSEVLGMPGTDDELSAIVCVTVAGAQRNDAHAGLLQTQHQMQRDLRVSRQQDRCGHLASRAGRRRRLLGPAQHAERPGR